MNSILRGTSLGIAAILLASACRAPHGDTGVRAYEAQGTIENIAQDQHVATIHHQAIAGFMPEMTMDFSIRDAHLLDGLSRGDQIAFTLDVTGDDSWIANLRRTGHVELPATGPAAQVSVPAFKIGDQLPDATFTAEDGKLIRFSDFRGKVVILTFFFTRCPLPDFCPRMNRNFAQARALLLSRAGAPKNWLFLSISFDPEFDTPQALSAYADFFRQHNPDRWLFVTATPEALSGFAAPLGLIVMRQDNTISHNLRTIVAGPDGRLFRQFNDNLWTPEQLAQAVIAAAASPTGK